MSYLFWLLLGGYTLNVISFFLLWRCMYEWQSNHCVEHYHRHTSFGILHWYQDTSLQTLFGCSIKLRELGLDSRNTHNLVSCRYSRTSIIWTMWGSDKRSHVSDKLLSPKVGGHERSLDKTVSWLIGFRFLRFYSMLWLIRKKSATYTTSMGYSGHLQSMMRLKIVSSRVPLSFRPTADTTILALPSASA